MLEIFVIFFLNKIVEECFNKKMCVFPHQIYQKKRHYYAWDKFRDLLHHHIVIRT